MLSDGCENLLTLYKEMQPAAGEKAELDKLLDQVKETHPIGMYVDVEHTTHIGIVVSYNNNLGGFYPGVRYPVNVKIIYSSLDKAVGCTFEYGADQLKPVNLYELAYYDVLNGVEPRFDSEEYVKHYNEWLSYNKCEQVV